MNTKIVVTVEKGIVISICGDPIDPKIELEFIVKDIDCINAGDPDPLNDIDTSDFVQYW